MNKVKDCIMVILDKCLGSSNTPNDLSDKVCAPNKTRFKSKRFQHDYGNKLIKNFNETYIIRKRKFDKRKCNSNQKWNKIKCWCECKKHHACAKDFILNPATSSKHLTSIFGDSVITCDEIMDAEVKLYDENAKTVTKYFYILHLFFISYHSIIDRR